MMYEENYLAHYGVKGMRWGVRKDTKRIVKDARKTLKQDAKTNKKSSDRRIKIKRGLLNTSTGLGVGLGMAGMIGGSATGNVPLALVSYGAVFTSAVVNEIGNIKLSAVHGTTIDKGQNYMNSNTANIHMQQQMNDMAMQESRRAASLALSGGMNPFMFG